MKTCPKPEGGGGAGKPPSRTAVGTAEVNPKPSKEQIVAAMKGMNKEELSYILRKVQELIRSTPGRRHA